MSNIKLFESKQIRSVWNELEQKWYFSVQDVVEVLTDSSDVKQYIKRMLSRDELLKSNWGTICTLVEMEAADGRKRKIQASDAKGLLRIIQSVPSPKAEPFKLWLAQVGSDRLDEIENPELATQRTRELYNLRDHMTDLELIFSMLGEASTKEIVVNTNPEGFVENKKAAKAGGKIAGDARKQLEIKSGKKVVTSDNFLPPAKTKKKLKK
jgi:hypothetical protein